MVVCANKIYRKMYKNSIAFFGYLYNNKIDKTCFKDK